MANEDGMKRKRPKMSVGQRAKQFMPFSALTGLGEALYKKEQEIENSVDAYVQEDSVFGAENEEK